MDRTLTFSRTVRGPPGLGFVAVAYQTLGSASEADDVRSEAWLR